MAEGVVDLWQFVGALCKVAAAWTGATGLANLSPPGKPGGMELA